MNEVLYLVFAFISGMLLGVLFFAGLWLTVKKAVSAKLPALWIFTSFILRVSIVLLGFYFIGSSHWQRLLAVTLGFTIARFCVIYYTKFIDQKRSLLKKETRYEA